MYITFLFVSSILLKENIIICAENNDFNKLPFFKNRFDEKFFTFCAKELTKINTFYAEKLAEATRKFATLKSEMEDSDTDHIKGQKKIQRRKVVIRFKHNLVINC